MLEYQQPQRWLARGALFDDLATASMDRVIGRDVRPWLPDAQQARALHRLQSEVQMLLYTHVFNDARAARGQVPINAFWVHGAGRLQPGTATGAKAAVQCLDDLHAAALQGNPLPGARPGRRWTPGSSPACWSACAQATRSR